MVFAGVCDLRRNDGSCASKSRRQWMMWWQFWTIRARSTPGSHFGWTSLLRFSSACFTSKHHPTLLVCTCLSENSTTKPGKAKHNSVLPFDANKTTPSGFGVASSSSLWPDSCPSAARLRKIVVGWSQLLEKIAFLAPCKKDTRFKVGVIMTDPELTTGHGKHLEVFIVDESGVSCWGVGIPSVKQPWGKGNNWWIWARNSYHVVKVSWSLAWLFCTDLLLEIYVEMVKVVGYKVVLLYTPQKTHVSLWIQGINRRDPPVTSPHGQRNARWWVLESAMWRWWLGSLIRPGDDTWKAVFGLLWDLNSQCFFVLGSPQVVFVVKPMVNRNAWTSQQPFSVPMKESPILWTVLGTADDA